MNVSNLPYYIWRGLYIAIKPTALFISSEIVDVGFSNLMALSILISGSLMASMSFGSYKKIFSQGKRSRNIAYFQNARRAIFILNILIIFFISMLASFFLDHNIILFVVLFAILEHSIHDESRIYLYSGDRTKWAQHNCLRTLFILLIPLILGLIEDPALTFVDIILLFSVLNFIYSKQKNGLFDFNKYTFAMMFRVKFYRYYLTQFNYFVSATVNRVMQQSDKFLVSFIGYEILWIYTILSQIMNIPLMMFELTFMSELKAKIANLRIHRFSLLNKAQIFFVIYASLMSIILYVCASFFIEQLMHFEFIFMAMIILSANFISAISMLNSERLFWHLKEPSLFRDLEAAAFVLGHIFLVPIIIFTGTYLFVKLPNIVCVLIKIRNSRKWLIT